MILFRAGKADHILDLNGAGAQLAGGRWNSKGIPVIYTSESKALCMFEVLAHVPLHLIPGNYKIALLKVPDSVEIKEIRNAELPENWDQFPFAQSTQLIGDNFILENKYLLMKVLSVVVKGAFNYLINPNHPLMKKVKIAEVEEFILDKRIW